MMSEAVIIIGYSGHAFVVAETLLAAGGEIIGYCDQKKKEVNPFELKFLGPENGDTATALLKKHPYIIGVGDNMIRSNIDASLSGSTVVAQHPTAWVSSLANVGDGVFINARATINALAVIGRAAIINTGAIIEHECQIGDYAHIAPGAVLAGNVSIGAKAFVGAGSVVRQGISIGPRAIIGAGAVVINDVPSDVTVIGNPARPLTL